MIKGKLQLAGEREGRHRLIADPQPLRNGLQIERSELAREFVLAQLSLRPLPCCR